MKRETIFFVIILTFLLSMSICAQSNFKIVFVGMPSKVSDSNWLSTIKDDWGATGVCIQVIWGYFDNDSSQGVDDWTPLDNALSAVDGAGLDIYVRVSMGNVKPSWVTPGSYSFTNDDFQTTADGNRFDYLPYNPDCPTGQRYPLNFVSSNSRTKMLDFYEDVLDHLDNSTYTIKEVVPTFSTDDEAEYPHAEMCGYSSDEIDAFKVYLKTKYSSSIDDLNEKWGSSFSNPSPDWLDLDLQLGDYDWEATSSYTHPNGRVDWMNFRTQKLADFINELADAAGSYSFEMGLQLGSIYDGNIEKRGWVDPARLLEKVNAVHTADVYGYSANFPFAADYLRSLCKFWNFDRSSGPAIRFSTETNWDLYNYETGGSGYTETQWRNYLKDKWTEQLESYYNRGAHELYIMGWGDTNDDIDQLTTDNSSWSATVKSYKNDPVVTTSLNYDHAVHLCCEKVLFYNHNAESSNHKFAIYDSLTAHGNYSSSTNLNYNDNDDIITNYMIEKNPGYLNQYDELNFTQLSQYITEKAYLGLMNSAVTTEYINGTHFYDGGHGEFQYTQGLKNEYNEIQSPIHLIWRSRPDLQYLWPFTTTSEANFIAESNALVSWAYNSGCGYSNYPSAREYPGWEIRDNGSTGNYKYDKNIRTVWDQRSDLQSVFTNGHTDTGNTWNMILWSKKYGYSSVPLLAEYNNWPYIGGSSLSKKNVIDDQTEIPSNFSLEQNYPNPFNPVTIIKYSIAKINFITMKVYDILGREISLLVNEVKAPGYYEIKFDARKLSSGIYIYTLQSQNLIISKKMLFLK